MILSLSSKTKSRYHSLVDRWSEPVSPVPPLLRSDGRFVFGNGLAQGPEDPQAAVG